MTHQNKDVFTTDGCSGGMSWLWRKLFKVPPPWEGGCIKHDLHYWIGGSKKDRRKADWELAKSVYHKAPPVVNIILSCIMWSVVRIFGSPYLPTPFRWGYGHGYKERKYDVRDQRDVALAIEIAEERGFDIEFKRSLTMMKMK